MGVPVYDGVREAVSAHAADASLVLVPAAFAKDAVMEAADNGIGLIVVPNRENFLAGTRWRCSLSRPIVALG